MSMHRDRILTCQSTFHSGIVGAEEVASWSENLPSNQAEGNKGNMSNSALELVAEKAKRGCRQCLNLMYRTGIRFDKT